MLTNFNVRLDELEQTGLQVLSGQVPQIGMLGVGEGVGENDLLDGGQVQCLCEVREEVRGRL